MIINNLLFIVLQNYQTISYHRQKQNVNINTRYDRHIHYFIYPQLHCISLSSQIKHFYFYDIEHIYMYIEMFIFFKYK